MPEEVLTAAKQRKQVYVKKLTKLVADHKGILILSIEHVGSNQMQQIRGALRGKATLLMGKNTLIRKILRDIAKDNEHISGLVGLMKGNVGLAFTNGDIKEVKDVIEQFKVPAAARTGVIAPTDFFIEPGPTGLDPGQTAFFQALNIPTKIQRGSIEIINKVHLIKAGEKVSSSAVALLSKLGVKPFFFGVKIHNVYDDGSMYSAAVLDLDDAQMLQKFFGGVQYIACVSLAVNFPTLASLPHSFARGFQHLLAISLGTEYDFEESLKIKEYLKNPGAAAPAAAAAAAPAAAKAAEPESDSEEEEGGFSLFD